MSGLKRAFTLSEVLITLVIIGIIAAIVIPSVIAYTDDLQYKVALKKNYSILKQAIRLVQINDYEDFRYKYPKHQLKYTTEFYNYLSKYLSVSKNCGHKDFFDCWVKIVKLKNGRITSGFMGTDNWADVQAPEGYAFVLNDGTSVIIDVGGNNNLNGKYGVSKSLIGENSFIFYVDVNGKKGPNMAGKDVYGFALTERGLTPFGNDNNSKNCNSSNNIGGLDCTALMLK